MRDEGIAAPRGQWSFNNEVTDAFEDMLERSIPDYAGMRDVVRRVGLRFVQPHTDVVDLGCSRGGALATFIEASPLGKRFVGVETSGPMIDAARARFAHETRAEVLDLDLREAYPDVHASLTLAVLTLMFVPIEYRQGLVRNVYERTAPGGAFVVVEKVLGEYPGTHSLLTGVYHEHKREAGYTQDAIDRKRYALEGRLVSMTSSANVAMLSSAGFDEVECVWRWGCFAGWVAVRGR